MIAVLFFGVIITLHEFGHFITAKLFGMRVNEFAIGMGPALFKKRNGQKILLFHQLAKEKKNHEQKDKPEKEEIPEGCGETVYSLRILPIGGFCALEGEDGDSEDERAFSKKKPWKRFIVLAAGATLNILLGLILMCALLLADGKVLTNDISYVSEAVQLEENSLQAGDKIIKVDGTRVFSTRDLSYCLFQRAENATAELTIKRNNDIIIIKDFCYNDSDDENATYFSVTQKDVTLLNCSVHALNETAAMAKLVYLSLIDMISGQYGLDDLSGPIGTVTIVAETATQAATSQDYSGMLFLLAFITVNIGIVNLLPLPALDGGRILFVLIEMLIRKPVPQKFEAIVHAVGMILLFALMALICFNDLRKIILN